MMAKVSVVLRFRSLRIAPRPMIVMIVTVLMLMLVVVPVVVVVVLVVLLVVVVVLVVFVSQRVGKTWPWRRRGGRSVRRRAARGHGGRRGGARCHAKRGRGSGENRRDEAEARSRAVAGETRRRTASSPCRSSSCGPSSPSRLAGPTPAQPQIVAAQPRRRVPPRSPWAAALAMAAATEPSPPSSDTELSLPSSATEPPPPTTGRLCMPRRAIAHAMGRTPQCVPALALQAGAATAAALRHKSTSAIRSLFSRPFNAAAAGALPDLRRSKSSSCWPQPAPAPTGLTSRCSGPSQPRPPLPRPRSPPRSSRRSLGWGAGAPERGAGDACGAVGKGKVGWDPQMRGGIGGSYSWGLETVI
ncbi:hypothetical protein PVAP13_3NG011890 [Panicum virgatum]|uniref:Uncharacterized protein n=1 Tax=Panicum virgatum TaxID=38727 RepID=A0A8T0TVL2_PANVG|nr:hypothetical protein PVAP13_3NG011890 [Panicum virgatum]